MKISPTVSMLRIYRYLQKMASAGNTGTVDNTNTVNTTDNTNTVDTIDTTDTVDFEALLLKDTMSRILIRLGDYKLERLPDILAAQNAVIAGSFPLQCAVNKTWADSDIDIFVEPKNTQPLHDYFSDCVFTVADSANAEKGAYAHVILTKITTYWVSFNSKYNIAEFAKPDVKYDYSERGALFFAAERQNEVPRDIEENMVKIQVIELADGDDPITHVLNTFDMDVCKITYTGNAVLYPRLIKKALTREASLDPTANYRGSEFAAANKDSARRRKYKQRKFKITIEKHDDELFDNPTMVKSTSKY